MQHTRFQLAAMAAIAALLVATPVYSQDEESSLDPVAEHLLAAEVALQSDDYQAAATEYRKAAELSDSVDIAKQAVRLAYDFGINDEGVRAAERWLELQPESDEALVNLGLMHLRSGNVRASSRSFSKFIEQSGQPGDEMLMSIMGFLSQEDEQLADKLIRSLAKPYEDSARANYAVAATALQADDLDVAMERSQIAISLDPDWTRAKLLHARVILLSGDIERAIDYTARIIGDDPAPDPDARMELALMYMTADREDDALSQVNQVLMERPQRTDALRMLAIINFRQNNLDVAQDDFEDLLASGDYTADALFYLARIADFKNEHDRAIRLYTQVVGGSNAITSQRRASALLAFQKEDPEAALKQLDEFAEKRPNYAIDVILAKAQLLGALGRDDEAIEGYDKAYSYRPDDEGIALGRAELLLRMDRVDDAVAAYREAAKRWPDSPLTLNALGYTLADRTDEFRDAEKFIRKALKYNPDSPAIIDSLGWVLHKRGKHAEALEQLQIAYEQFPDPEVAAHVVEVLVALDRADEALEFLLSAEEKDPESELLLDVRERLFPETP